MNLYVIARFFAGLWCRMCYRVTIEGREHIPEKGGYILVSNHRDNADPVLIATALRQQLHFMAKAELFSTRLTNWFFLNIGAFPVERGKGDTGAVEWAMEQLQKGNILAMFPEGTRAPTDVPLRPKSGAAHIARSTGADVLPCAVRITEKKWARRSINIRFGEIIKNSTLGFEDPSPRALKTATHLIWGKVLDLLGVAHEN